MQARLNGLSRGARIGGLSLLVIVALMVTLAWAVTMSRRTDRMQYKNGLQATSNAFVVHTLGTSTVTFQGADAAGAANTAYDTTGAGAVTVGSADVTAVTVTTDGAGDAEVVLPENSVGGSEVSGMPMALVLCGQADESGTIYLSPAAGVNGVDLADGVDYSIAGTACDGLDGATEATQDLILFPDAAFKVTGMYCMTDGTLGSGETVIFAARSAAAALTPAVTCTVSEGETGCRGLTGSTTDVAAGATLAMQAIQTGDNSDDNLWCQLNIMLQ